jgi:Leucine-rich repeat (LRR) protein
MELNHLNVPNLLYLDLSHNEITSFNYKTCNLGTLRNLHLQFNKFSKITEEFCLFFVKLTSFYLNNNIITSINNNFGYLSKNVLYLNLSRNYLKHYPYSYTNLKLEMCELDNAYFDTQKNFSDHNENMKYGFPKLTELTARLIAKSK